MQDFNQEIQKLFLEMFLSDAEAFVRCQGIFESENFDQQLRDGAEFISKYVDEYKVMPELDIVNTSCGTTLKDASSIAMAIIAIAIIENNINLVFAILFLLL